MQCSKVSCDYISLKTMEWDLAALISRAIKHVYWIMLKIHVLWVLHSFVKINAVSSFPFGGQQLLRIWYSY